MNEQEKASRQNGDDDAAPTPSQNTATNEGVAGVNDLETETDEVFADAADTPVTDEVDEIDELRQQLQDAEQRTLRAQADLENFRKRTRREIDDQQRYACMPLIRDLLPVIDNLNRAMATVQPDESAQGLLEGVKMVAQQLTMVLETHNCRKIEATSAEFDPMFHEAISEMPSEEHPPGTVIEVAQTGYRLHDRVVRPTQVVVSKGKA